MWTITKQFDFCYGHRVWSQSLNPDFSLDSCLKCRHLHGHQGTIHVSLQAKKLEDGMVTDFKHLNWFKRWLDDTLDHKFIIDNADPALELLFPDLRQNLVREDVDGVRSFRVPGPHLYNRNKALDELYEGLVVVDFVPTSENLSKWLFDIVSFRMSQLGVITQQVQFYETPKSQSIYSNL